MNVDDILRDAPFLEEINLPTNTPRNCLECDNVFLGTRAEYCPTCQIAVAVKYIAASVQYERWGVLPV